MVILLPKKEMLDAFGTISTKLDSKNRLKIPARFKELISEYRKLYFYKGLNGTYYLDVPPVWKKTIARIKSKANRFNPKFAVFEQHFFNAAFDLNIDDHGRVVLSQHIMDLLKLQPGGELVVQGVGDGLALYAKTEFENILRASENTYESVAAQLFADDDNSIHNINPNDETA